jgi:hypothetical protein
MNKGTSGEEEFSSQEADGTFSLCLLALAADALDVIVLVWQLDDEVICLSNEWAMRVQGSSRLTYLDPMAMRALIHPNDHPALDSALGSCLRGGNCICSVNLRLRTPSGWLPVTARGRATAFSDTGHVTRIVASLTEITHPYGIDALRRRDTPSHRHRPLQDGQ